MPGEFASRGRALLAGGYLIIPIKPGHKAPAIGNWQNARLGAGDLARYSGHGVGVLCGQGAQPVCAIDIDTADAQLAARFASWCHDHLGATVERVGNAPKVLLVYRAGAEGWAKRTGAWFEDVACGRHRVEVLGRGQQFVAYAVHPDTGKPYKWMDVFGGLESMPAADLPTVTEAQVAHALDVFERMALDAGLTCVAPSAGSTTALLTASKAADNFFSRVNTAALGALDVWVPLLFPDARNYQGGYRVSSSSLGRELEEDISIVASGIVDFGVADMGDARDGKRTPIDLVLEWAPYTLDDPLAIAGVLDAALWLCERLGVTREDMGWGKPEERKYREAKAGKVSALEDQRRVIEECYDSLDLVNIIAPKAGAAAGTDLAIRAELAGLIRQRFKDITNTPLPAADLRLAMRPPKPPKEVPATAARKSRRDKTEFGNAERLLDHYGAGLMYVPELDAWFTWTGVYWRRAAGVELEHLAKETIRALPKEADGIEGDQEREAFYKFCAVSQRAVMVANMVRLAASDPRVVVSAADLDRHSHLLGVANGMVDLHSGELLGPDPASLITVATHVAYDVEARAPLFEETVSDVFFGDASMVSFFQRLIGYALLGRPDEDVLAIPYGSGSNGKSTVLGAIRHALGEHARMAQADTFLANGAPGTQAGGAREDVLRLRGARFVYITEPDEGSELREGLIKSMTGGEAIPARGLYAKATVEVQPTWVAFMPTNHRPIVKGDDQAIWRRLLPVPFTRNFDADIEIEKDTARSAKLDAEAPGILRWAVQGAIAYQKEGLHVPGTVGSARAEYRTDMDLLAEWLEQCCEIDSNHVESNPRLWASWEGFARSRNELRFVSSSRHLTRRLESRGFLRVKDRSGLEGRGFAGLRVRQTGDF